MAKFKIEKVALDALHDGIRAKLKDVDTEGRYRDEDLQRGGYASGYMQALIDVYRIVEV